MLSKLYSKARSSNNSEEMRNKIVALDQPDHTVDMDVEDEEKANSDSDDEVISTNLVYRTNHLGQRQVKAKGSSVWIIIVPVGTEISFRQVTVEYRSRTSTLYECSVCLKKIPLGHIDFHKRFTHFEGHKCEDCGYVAFTRETDRHHACSLENIYVLKDNEITVSFGRPEYRAYALPLITPLGGRILWIGHASGATAEDCANNQLAKQKAAKKNNYKRKNTKSSGCTSLNDLLDPLDKAMRHEPLPKEAFFFDTIGGGNQEMENLKFFLRRCILVESHHSTKLSEFLFKPFAPEIFENLWNDERIPECHKESLMSYAGHYSNYYDVVIQLN